MKYPPPPLGEDEDEDEERQGDSYSGPMSHGKRHGKATYTWANGAVFDGEYKDNKKDGKGKMTFADKGVYEGASVWCMQPGPAVRGELSPWPQPGPSRRCSYCASR